MASIRLRSLRERRELLPLHDATVAIGQSVAGPARLGTDSAIAAPAGRGLTHVALPAVRNA